MLRFLNALLILFPVIALSQQHEVKHLIKYNQSDGLSSYNVRKIIQDSYGFIWVATQDGLSKFDGNSFFNYSKNAEEKHRLCGVDIRTLIEDTSRRLIWVLPGEYGINAISTVTGEVIYTIPIPYATSEEWNITMTRKGEKLWIGTSTGVKIFDINSKRFEADLPLPEKPVTTTEFEVRSFVEDDYGNVWVCYSGYGIIIYNSVSRQPIKNLPITVFDDHFKSGEIKFFGFTKKAIWKVLLGTSQGLREVQYDKSYSVNINNTPCSSVKSLNDENIQNIISYRNDILIAGANALYRFDSTLLSYSIFEEAARFGETDWLNAVQCMSTDKQGNLWLGCQEGLAFIAKKSSPFTVYNYDKLTNTKLDHVRCVFPLSDGGILAGLRNGIVYIDRSKRYRKSDSIHLYHHIFQDKNGLVHVSRSDGMFVHYKSGLVPIQKLYSEFSRFSTYPINSHLFINDSIIMLGTENDKGILLWDHKNKIVTNILKSADDGLGSNIVNNIFRETRKNIWILSDNIITILSPEFKRIKTLSFKENISNKPYSLYFDMCEAQNYYWITCYGFGVIQLDGNYNLKKIYSNKDGLSNDGVYQIYNVGDTSLLVTSNNGLSILNLNTKRFKNFFIQDGLHSNGFEEVCGLRKGDVIYAGGVNGFTVIDTKSLTSNQSAPALFISNIKIHTDSGLKDSTNLSLREIHIPSNVLQTTIFFSGLNYENPTRTLYTYKINEIHSNWINLSSQNFINLIGLSPGTYHLQVKAANEDGVWSDPIELTLIFLPKWYQTWWFKILLVLLSVAIVVGLYRYRIRQLKKEQLIRTKLASDLHDDLGSTLNSVKVYANLAILEKGQEKHLFKIKESTQEAISSIRDMIWVLDDRKDSIGHLLTRIDQFAIPLCEANGIDYKKNVAGDVTDYRLNQEEKRNLYMVIKESINNSIKYAEGSQLFVTINLPKGKPEVIVKDNGKGFDIDKVAYGNGLKNIKFRATQIKYQLNIESSAGNGTIIRLQKT